MPDQEPFADKGDQLAGRGEEVNDEVSGEEDLEAEREDQRAKSSGEGIPEKVKEKGKELLDKISGPDVPPSLADECAWPCESTHLWPSKVPTFALGPDVMCGA